MESSKVNPSGYSGVLSLFRLQRRDAGQALPYG